MQTLVRVSVFLSLLCGWLNAGAAKQTNFVFILVDDMGWADIGANGSQFHESELAFFVISSDRSNAKVVSRKT